MLVTSTHIQAVIRTSDAFLCFTHAGHSVPNIIGSSQVPTNMTLMFFMALFDNSRPGCNTENFNTTATLRNLTLTVFQSLWQFSQNSRLLPPFFECQQNHLGLVDEIIAKVEEAGKERFLLVHYTKENSLDHRDMGLRVGSQPARMSWSHVFCQIKFSLWTIIVFSELVLLHLQWKIARIISM